MTEELLGVITTHVRELLVRRNEARTLKKQRINAKEMANDAKSESDGA